MCAGRSRSSPRRWRRPARPSGSRPRTARTTRASSHPTATRRRSRSRWVTIAEEGIKDVIDVVERADDRSLRGGDHGRVHRGRRPAHALEQGSEGGRALLRPAGGAARAAVRLRRRRRLVRAVAAGDRLDRLRAGARRDRRSGVGGLVLHRQHAHGHGPRARGRLCALRRLPLPRGAGAGNREGRCDRGDRTNREPGGALQRHGVRDRAQRDAARAGHDPAQPRARRRSRRGDDGGGGDDPAAGGAVAARRPGRCAAAPVPGPRCDG